MERGFRWYVVWLLWLSLAASSVTAQTSSPERKAMRIYIGTFTGHQSASMGIYLVEVDAQTGALSEPKVAAEVRRPGFLAAHPTRPLLYAVNELNQAGAVSAFAIDPQSGMLSLLNQQPTAGKGPCFITLDAQARHVLIANYSDGVVEVLPLDDDGRLRPASSVQRHQGSGAHPRRQQGPHAHSIYPDPSGRFALAVDLGIDRVMIYRFDAQRGRLSENDPAYAQLAAGAGPRHLVFAPSRRFVYVGNELDNTVTVFEWDSERGAMSEVQTIATLPADFRDENTVAEVAVHPSGQFLYCSNRGHDSLAIFAVDEASGKLTARGHASTQGRTPRHFALDPGGRFLIVANQNSDNLVVFRVDQETGDLSATGVTISVSSPTCVRFVGR